MHASLFSSAPTASCEDASFEEALNLYLDGELSFDAQPALFHHLACCESCRHTLDAVMTLRRVMRQEHLAVPPAADDAFFQRLAEHKSRTKGADRPGRRRRRLPSARLSFRSAATVLVLVFVAGLMVPMDQPEAEVRVASLVVGEEEVVEFLDSARQRPEAVYVFYPGLTIEAVKPAELQPGESL